MFSPARCPEIGHLSDCRAFWPAGGPGQSGSRGAKGGGKKRRRQALPVSNQRRSGVMDEHARTQTHTPPMCILMCAHPPVKCLKLNSACFVTSSSIKAKRGVSAKKLKLRRGELLLLMTAQQPAFMQLSPNPPSSCCTTTPDRLVGRQRVALVVATSL